MSPSTSPFARPFDRLRRGLRGDLTTGERLRGLEAVLFDFDHTLTDLGKHVRWTDARPVLQQLYREAGVPEPFLDEHHGSISLYTAVAALEPLPAPALVEVQRRASAVLASIEAEAIASTAALPGVEALPATLGRLGLRAGPSTGLRTGIVSSNAASVVVAILERLALRPAFEVVIGRDEVSRLKPSPEGLLAACRALDVAPAAAAYVGDASADMEAARSAGLRAWGVATGLGTPEQLRAAGASCVFATLDEVFADPSEHAPLPLRQAQCERGAAVGAREQ